MRVHTMNGDILVYETPEPHVLVEDVVLVLGREFVRVFEAWLYAFRREQPITSAFRLDDLKEFVRDNNTISID